VIVDHRLTISDRNLLWSNDFHSTFTGLWRNGESSWLTC
jgi:hypothetical protein